MQGKRSLLAAICVTSWFASHSLAFAFQPCPSQSELYKQAKLIVKAKALSYAVVESGLLDKEGLASRVTRVELEILKVLKGDLKATKVIASGVPFPPGPYAELNMMALYYGLVGDPTFEIELDATEIGEQEIQFYNLSSCIYYKFPDFADPLHKTQP